MEKKSDQVSKIIYYIYPICVYYLRFLLPHTSYIFLGSKKEEEKGKDEEKKEKRELYNVIFTLRVYTSKNEQLAAYLIKYQ